MISKIIAKILLKTIILILLLLITQIFIKIDTESTQSSDLLNTTLPTLPNLYTPLPRLQTQNSVHFTTEPVILNNSTQPILTKNQNNQMTQQKLVSLVRQLNSQNSQHTTNAPTPYYLQATSTQTPPPVDCKNTQMMYPYLRGSVPMQQSLRSFDGTDPTYTTEDFLKAITANMVITAGSEQIDSPYQQAWNLKRIAMTQTALIGPAQQWYSHLPQEKKKTGKRFAVNSRRHSVISSRKHKRNQYYKA